MYKNITIFENYYNDLPENQLNYTLDLLQSTNKFYRPFFNNNSESYCCIFTYEYFFTAKTDTEKFEKKFNKGTVIIFDKEFIKRWKFHIPEDFILLYEEDYLNYVSNTIKQRLIYSKSLLSKTQNISNDIKDLELKIIGKGSYGNVYKTHIGKLYFACKFTKIKKEHIERIYDKNLSSWHDNFILKNILNPIIDKKICPNVPYLFDNFIKKDHELVLDDTKTKETCIVSLIELANGDLLSYLNGKRTVHELKNCLFQIMAGLHAIQKHAQIWHFDIKSQNILYYNTEVQGYWKYVIKGIEYYVPNLGKLFILNDFGVSKVLSPNNLLASKDEDEYLSVGSRYAYIKDGKFIPINIQKPIKNNKLIKPIKIIWDNDKTKMSTGCKFFVKRKNGKILDLKPDVDFDIFKDPEITPPFEFYNDLQDVLKIFVGGKKATQKGKHKSVKVPNAFKNSLNRYIGLSENYKDTHFSTDPSQILASYFIESYFQEYKKKPKGKINILETYYI